MHYDILYFDMFSGISGDMCAGAFLDLGLDRKELQDVLNRLPVHDEFTITSRKVKRSGIQGIDFNVKLTGHHHHGHEHHHRTMRDIRTMLTEAPIPDKTRKTAIAIFSVLAKAEGSVHGMPWLKVHFHEVGAIDSIVDIVTAAFAIEFFGSPQCFASPLHFGTGCVSSQHGIIPLPAPATLEVSRGLPVIFTGRPMELTTPTGAAIIKTLIKDPDAPLPECSMAAVGYGVGNRQSKDIPNMLRITGGMQDQKPEQVIELQTNIDDTTPETIGYLFQRLLNAGVLDCSAESIIMKKGRPGTRISVLVHKGKAEIARSVLFTETGTFGIREYRIKRSKLKRDFITAELDIGTVQCKVGYYKGAVVTVAPEFEDCRRLAEVSGQPLKNIYAEAARLGQAQLK